MYANHAATRAVKIGDQKERDGSDKRQHEERQFALTLLAVPTSKLQEIAIRGFAVQRAGRRRGTRQMI